MEHFKIDLTNGNIIERAEDFTDAWREEVRAQMSDENDRKLTELMKPYITLNDCRNMMIAERMAEQLNDEANAERFMAIDRGEHIYPQFKVIEVPQIGDAVSYAFNGDSTPCGHIKSISPTKKRVTTTTGHVFYRKNNSGSWLKNRTWSLVAGHVTSRNPHL